ncbi:hypothetical protein Peur_056291 [Populus x canadensis]
MRGFESHLTKKLCGVPLSKLGGGRAVAIHQRCLAAVYSTELGNLGMRRKDLLDRIREEEEEDKHLLGIM